MLSPDSKGTTIMKIVSAAGVAGRCAERQGNGLQCRATGKGPGAGQLSP